MGRSKLRILPRRRPGVGKTYAMLNEAGAASSGDDVVVGAVETHGWRRDGRSAGLEVVPPFFPPGHELRGDGLDAVLAWEPAGHHRRRAGPHQRAGLAATTSASGGRQILDAGINVLSTLNIQHLESVNDVVERITGVRQQGDHPRRLVRR